MPKKENYFKAEEGRIERQEVGEERTEGVKDLFWGEEGKEHGKSILWKACFSWLYFQTRLWKFFLFVWFNQVLFLVILPHSWMWTEWNSNHLLVVFYFQLIIIDNNIYQLYSQFPSCIKLYTLQYKSIDFWETWQNAMLFFYYKHFRKIPNEIIFFYELTTQRL